MAVGLLRPDAGRSRVFGIDVWSGAAARQGADGRAARRPGDAGAAHRPRAAHLPRPASRARHGHRSTHGPTSCWTVLELDGDAERTLIIDYSSGMRKKIGLATALLHGPRLLVLDEPFEAVDPVSAATLKRILKRFVAGGGVGAALEPRDGAGRAALRHGRGDGEGPGRRRGAARRGARATGRSRRRSSSSSASRSAAAKGCRGSRPDPDEAHDDAAHRRRARGRTTMLTGAVLGVAAAIATIALATLDADEPTTLWTCSPSRSRSGPLGWALAPAYGGQPVLRARALRAAADPAPQARARPARRGVRRASSAAITLVAFAAHGRVRRPARRRAGAGRAARPGAAARARGACCRGWPRGCSARCRGRAPAARSARSSPAVMLVVASSGWIVFVALDAVLATGFSDGVLDRDPGAAVELGAGGGRGLVARRLATTACRCSAWRRWWRCSCCCGPRRSARSGWPGRSCAARPERSRRRAAPTTAVLRQGAAQLVARPGASAERGRRARVRGPDLPGPAGLRLDGVPAVRRRAHRADGRGDVRRTSTARTAPRCG